MGALVPLKLLFAGFGVEGGGGDVGERGYKGVVLCIVSLSYFIIFPQAFGEHRFAWGEKGRGVFCFSSSSSFWTFYCIVLVFFGFFFVFFVFCILYLLILYLFCICICICTFLHIFFKFFIGFLFLFCNLHLCLGFVFVFGGFFLELVGVLGWVGLGWVGYGGLRSRCITVFCLFWRFCHAGGALSSRIEGTQHAAY